MTREGYQEEIQAWPGPGEEPWWWEKCGDTMRNAQIWARGLAEAHEASEAREEARKEAREEARKEEERFRSPLYIRFGHAPVGGVSIASWDRTKPAMERGLSVFRGYRDEEGAYVVDTEKEPKLLGAYKSFVHEGRPVYLAEGVEVAEGACSEPVLASPGVKLTALPDGARVRCSGHWQDYAHFIKWGSLLLRGELAPPWITAPPPEFTVGVTQGSPARGFLKTLSEASEVDPTTPDGKLKFVDEVTACYACPAALWGADPHGPEHWKRVAVAGARLLRDMSRGHQIDALVVFLFSIFHDAHRVAHGNDPWHGWRAAEKAREMLDGKITVEQLDRLAYAVEYHDLGKVSADPTIGVCWDADRLNLWRVGRTPDPRLLSTEAARTPELIAWVRKLQAEHFSWPEVVALYDGVGQASNWEETA